MKGIANWIFVIGSVIIGLSIFFIGSSLLIKQIRTTQKNTLMEEVQDFSNKLKVICNTGGKYQKDYYNMVLPDSVRAVYVANNSYESPPDKVSLLISEQKTTIGNHTCIQFFDDNLPICESIDCLMNFTYIGSPSLKPSLQTLIAKLLGNDVNYNYRVEIEKTDEYFLAVISKPIV